MAGSPLHHDGSAHGCQDCATDAALSTAESWSAGAERSAHYQGSAAERSAAATTAAVLVGIDAEMLLLFALSASGRFFAEPQQLASVLQAASFSILHGPPRNSWSRALEAFSLVVSLSPAAGHRSFGLANRSTLVNLRLGSFDSCLLRPHSWRRRRTGSAGSSRSPARPRRERACSARSARGSAPTIARSNPNADY